MFESDIYLKSLNIGLENQGGYKMSEKRYIISDASKMLDVESHVLRYWEEELEIKIPRNEMGHRYYTENHINLLRNVRDLKRQGYGLRTIRMMIGGNPKELPETTIKTNKMEQFQEIMGDIVAKALRESGKEMGHEIGQGISAELSEKISKNVSTDVSESVLKEMDYRLRMSEEREEERYKKLDEAIRSRQKAAKKHKEKKKKTTENKGIMLFRKNKRPQTT